MNLRHGRMNLEQFHFGNYLQLPRWIFMTIWGILAKTTNRRKFYWGRRDNLSLQRGKIIDIIKKINSFPKKKKKKKLWACLCSWPWNKMGLNCTGPLMYKFFQSQNKKERKLYNFPVFQIGLFVLFTHILFRESFLKMW